MLLLGLRRKDGKGKGNWHDKTEKGKGNVTQHFSGFPVWIICSPTQS